MASNITLSKLEYLGTFKVEIGKQYLSSDIVANATDATAFIVKSRGKMVNGIREYINVSINDTATIPLDYNEKIAYVPARNPAIKYKFSQDCILLVVKEL